MKKEYIKCGLLSAISVVLLAWLSFYFTTNRGTDMIMPAVEIFDGMTRWYVMLLGIVAELVIVKWALKENWFKAASVTLFVNMVSTALGIIMVFVLGLLVELMFFSVEVGTFHVSHWAVTFLLMIPMNACLESLAAKLAFKLRFRKLFPGLCLANAASIVICIVLNLSWISSMHF